jgi:ribonuclease HI
VTSKKRIEDDTNGALLAIPDTDSALLAFWKKKVKIVESIMLEKSTCKLCDRKSLVIKCLQVCTDCIVKARKKATPGTATALKWLLNAQNGEMGSKSVIENPVVIFTDGGARCNPGPAGIGVIVMKNGEEIISFGRYIGNATNNVAEYSALVEGLKSLHDINIGKDETVVCYSDSELMVKQLNGEYAVRKDHLAELHGSVMALAGNFDSIHFKHVSRDNKFMKKVDRLVNEAIDGET